MHFAPPEDEMQRNHGLKTSKRKELRKMYNINENTVAPTLAKSFASPPLAAIMKTQDSSILYTDK